MPPRTDQGLDSWSKASLMLLALSLFFLAFIVDLLLAGYAIHLPILYLLPIVVAARFLGRTSGIVFSVFSAGAWLFAIQGTDFTSGHPLLGYWNILIGFMFLLTVTLIVAGQRAVRIALRIAQERESDLSRRDALTGLANNRSFFERAEEALRSARQSAQSLAVVFIDLDDLRALNHCLGRRAGDAVLVDIATGIGQLVRPQDVCGRIGGDEFAIVLGGIDADAARSLALAFQAMCKDLHTRGGWPVQASIGIAVTMSAREELNTLLSRAEQLAYKVKDRGKGHFLLETLAGDTISAPTSWMAAESYSPPSLGQPRYAVAA